jgi:hypothetical protein
MDQTLAEVLEFEVPATIVSGHRVGHIVAFDTGGVLVDYPGNPHGPHAARLAVPLDASAAAAAASERRAALLTFEHERSDSPIIVGFMHAAPTPARAAPEPATAPAPRFDASVDGRRAVVEAEDELVLRCGQASITLRRNGRLSIRGVFVETRARQVNRIKGGSVQIN